MPKLILVAIVALAGCTTPAQQKRDFDFAYNMGVAHGRFQCAMDRLKTLNVPRYPSGSINERIISVPAIDEEQVEVVERMPPP